MENLGRRRYHGASRDAARGAKGSPAMQEPVRGGFGPRHAVWLALALLAGGFGCGERSAVPLAVTLRLAESSTLHGLDPIHATTIYESRHVMNLYDGLVELSYLDRPQQILPALAAALPEVSQNRREYSFRLRPGVRFHDDPCFGDGRGREVTSQDWAYSLKRIADAKNGSGGWWMLEGRILGLDAFRAASQRVATAAEVDYDAPVEGLDASDPRTFRLRLTRPYPQLLQVLAGAYARVVPREAVERYGQDFGSHPVGTGPFQLERWVRGSRLEYRRNPGYREEVYPSRGTDGDQEAGLLADAGRRVPLVDRVVVQVLTEDQPRWLAFLEGGIDLLEPPKDNIPGAFPSGLLSSELRARGVRVATVPTLDVARLVVNMDDPVLGRAAGESGLALRRALSAAIDRDAFIQTFFGGRAVAARSVLPPGLETGEPEGDLPWMRFDPARAAAYLVEAGFPGGEGLEPLEVAVSADSSSRQRGEFLQRSLDRIGVRLEVASYSWPELNRRIRNRQLRLWSMGWQAEYLDPSTVFCGLYGPSASPGINGSNYASPEFDRDYQVSVDLEPGPERDALYRGMARRANRDLPWIPLSHTLSDTLVHGWLHGFKPSELATDHYWKFYRVDEAARRRFQGGPRL